MHVCRATCEGGRRKYYPEVSVGALANKDDQAGVHRSDLGWV
jgi:hypothetical protein